MCLEKTISNVHLDETVHELYNLGKNTCNNNRAFLHFLKTDECKN